MKFKTCRMNPDKPQRVAIALQSEYSPGRDTVYWSPRGLHDGRGGFNSFVLVEDAERGAWRMEDGRRVNLLSINGIGEVRWEVEPGSLHYGEGAHNHFRLVPAEERQIYVVETKTGFAMEGDEVFWRTHHWECAKEAAKYPDCEVLGCTVERLVELKRRIRDGEV